jgi:2-methylcitrate dehydratase PrpD
VATAIAKRRATIQDYTDQAAKDPAMHELTNRISAEIDSDLTGGSIEPTRVRIKTKGGKEFIKQVDVPLGSPQKPFSQADIKGKLKDCNSVSIKPLSDETLEKLIETMQRFEEFGDIGPVLSRLFKE